MVVAVDIGNSAMKLAHEASPLEVVRISKSSGGPEFEQQLARFAQRLRGVPFNQWLASSVDQNRLAELSVWLHNHRPEDQLHIISSDDIPLNSSVEDRRVLGRDRLLVSWFAATLNDPQSASIVVDAGTAVTIDVTVDDLHLGGLIFPGSGTCLQALETQTDALPNLSLQPPPNISTTLSLGKSTQDAILLGVHQLQLFGLVAMVRSLQEQYSCSTVICCGGALIPCAPFLPESWKHHPNFVTDAIFELSNRIFDES